MEKPAKFEFAVTIGLSPSLLAIVSALVTSAGIALPASSETVVGNSTPIGDGIPAAKDTPPAPASPAPAGAPAAPASPEANGGEEIDRDGHPWSAELHASTKGKTKDGLWRMKVGVSRPNPLPGFPKTDGAASAPEAAASGSPTPPANTPAPPAPPAPPADPNRPADANFRHDNGDGTEQWYVNGAWDGGKHAIPSDTPAAPAAAEDDEFAAFATGSAAAAAAPAARSWTDADLSKLCNQAALAAGGPEKVKPIIAKYMPEGVAAHSRHVPEAQREAFAREVEEAHGITYAG